MSTAENLTNNDDVVLQNISNCINDKLAILNIKLSELARISEIDYFTLRKIANNEFGYLPNLRVLIKLANYFNIKVGDLLNYNNLPQYIPIINKNEINDYLTGKLEFNSFSKKLFNDKFIHDKAFAIKEINNDLIIPAEIIYLCYPYHKYTLTIGQVYLFDNNTEKLFGKLLSIHDSYYEISIGYTNKKVSSNSVIAIVISIQMSKTTI